MIIVMFSLFGLIFGSFLNVLLWRLPEGQGIGGRSRCRSCGHILAWYDLVPVLSFIFLKARCRHCQGPIHIRYPLIELAAALSLGAYIAVVQPALTLQTVFMAAGILILVSLLFFDHFHMILPAALPLPAIP